MSGFTVAGVRRRSLRVRITLLAMLIVAAVILVVGVASAALIEREMVDEVDRALAVEADLVRRRLPAWEVRAPDSEVELLVQVIEPSGRVVGGSAPLKNLGPLVDVDTGGSQAQIVAVMHPDLGALRVSVQYLPDVGMTLLVAKSRAAVDDALSSLRQVLIFVGPVVILVVALVIHWAVGRALRRVELVRDTARSIGRTDLSLRVPLTRNGDEIDQLSSTMNEMLDRVEASIERERRFVSDASHELRSPLAGLRLLLETECDSTDRHPASRAGLLEPVARLQRIVDDLLVLDPNVGRGRSALAEVDLDDLVLSHAERLRRTTELEIDTASVSGGRVIGDVDDLARVIDNLASNACRHAESIVSFGLEERAAGVVLHVDDDGHGIEPDVREAIFERFTRLDDARTRDVGGAGLGLAIVKEIVDRHGRSVSVEQSPSGGARFSVTFARDSAGRLFSSDSGDSERLPDFPQAESPADV